MKLSGTAGVLEVDTLSVGMVGCGATETGAVGDRFTKDSSSGDGWVGGSGGVILTFTTWRYEKAKQELYSGEKQKGF